MFPFITDEHRMIEQAARDFGQMCIRDRVYAQPRATGADSPACLLYTSRCV